MRKAFEKQGFSDSVLEIITASLADSTKKQYDSALKSWWTFCTNNHQDPFEPEIKTVVEFLAGKFKEGASYSTLNSTRSAISLIVSKDLQHDPILHRCFKGIFRLRPTAPKYFKTWDVNVVLDKLASWFPLDSLSLKLVTEKLVMLLALGTGFRAQTLSLIKIEEISITSSTVEIKVYKTSRPGAQQPFACIPFFRGKPSICIASTLVHYLKITRELRKDENLLFICYKKPYKGANVQSIRRWIKSVLKNCGIDKSFTAHSTRHASTSAAYKKGLDLNIIRNAAGWSGESKMFARFYNRTIDNQEGNFASTVLN
ncbi:uncharacterized protein LOC100678277 isoform X1 [Nasonia vitripennis]|uniref:Tyr recombinase domain-containing protein n=1 Tax=Nasonia vitripennis TaxID=7425 RepID=A0A7M7QZN3_NASVI|nr:uncharacterized protein LOC100678277 isoform X1 [Nasonia vitripennis]